MFPSSNGRKPNRVVAKVKRRPHASAQVVAAVLTLVVIKVWGPDVADSYHPVILLIAPIVAAFIADRYTVPWREVLRWIEQMNHHRRTGAAEGDPVPPDPRNW